MADLGLTWVRIGEFAWSRLEPVEGQYDFAWLDQAIDILGRYGVQVVLGTRAVDRNAWMKCEQEARAHEAVEWQVRLGHEREPNAGHERGDRLGGQVVDRHREPR